jgi:hypothetical protein
MSGNASFKPTRLSDTGWCLQDTGCWNGGVLGCAFSDLSPPTADFWPLLGADSQLWSLWRLPFLGASTDPCTFGTRGEVKVEVGETSSLFAGHVNILVAKSAKYVNIYGWLAAFHNVYDFC